MGRPSDYSLDLADRICEHLAGGRSLLSFCQQDGTPGYETVRRWLREDRKVNPDDPAEEGFRVKYARAREEQADRHADRVLELAERMEVARKGRDYDEVAPLVAACHERKWLASKMRPKVYGDKQAVEHTGEGGGPLTIEFRTVGEGGE